MFLTGHWVGLHDKYLLGTVQKILIINLKNSRKSFLVSPK
jgi:hypothetical protein